MKKVSGVVGGLLVGLIILLLVGCGAIKPVCRHNAVSTAILYAEQGKNVRIASYAFDVQTRTVTKLRGGFLLSTSYDVETRHAEPQVEVNGKWRFIEMDCEENFTSNVSDYKILGSIQYYGIHEYLYKIGIK